MLWALRHPGRGLCQQALPLLQCVWAQLHNGQPQFNAHRLSSTLHNTHAAATQRSFSFTSFSTSSSSSTANPTPEYSSAVAAADQPAARAGAAAREPETPLLHAIRNRILIRGGPLSVAEYMQEVLTNPVSGYYMKRDVFGRRGDFTTSPEISQMFGEMVGIWCVVAWQQLGCPSCLQLVELGPGRGTLMADLLRGTAAFKPFADALQVHLVEVSPYLRREQWNKLQCSSSSGSSGNSSNSGGSSSSGSSGGSSSSSSEPLPDEGISGLNGAKVCWHASLDAVPTSGPSIFLAHEFLDALPVHQFVRDPRRGWLEVMVDTVDETEPDSGSSSSNSSSTRHAQHNYEGVPLVKPQLQQQQQNSAQQQQSKGSAAAAAAPSDQGLHLKLVLSPSPTPAAQLLVKRRLEALEANKAPQQQQQGQQEQQQSSHVPLQAVEIGAQAMAVVETLSRRIAASGGAALLIDYGADKPYTDSLTAIRNHQGVHPLSQPGTADLSAWVDFSAMRMAAEQAFDIQPLPAAPAAGGAGAAAATAAAAAAGKGNTGGSSSSAESGSSSSSSAQGGSPSAGVEVFGPVTQEHLLHSLGIQARLQALAEAATPQQAEELVSGYKRLTDTGPGGMGATYLALAITQQGLGTPVGFEEQQQQQQGAAA